MDLKSRTSVSIEQKVSAPPIAEIEKVLRSPYTVKCTGERPCNNCFSDQGQCEDLQKPDIVSIDIETLSLEPNAVVLSIGACIVGTDKTFYATCNVEQQIRAGRDVSKDTMAFWSTQPVVFIDLLTDCIQNPDCTLLVALTRLEKFISENCAEPPLVYSKGRLDFDVLEEAYKSTGANTTVDQFRIPWTYRGVRCLRTLIEAAKIDEANLPFRNPDAHNALSDSLYQAEIIELAREELGI